MKEKLSTICCYLDRWQTFRKIRKIEEMIINKPSKLWVLGSNPSLITLETKHLSMNVGKCFYFLVEL